MGAEPALDIEVIAGMAHNATIDVYQTGDCGTANNACSTSLYGEYSQIVNANVDRVVSISLGICEANPARAGVAAAEVGLFLQAAIQGQGVFASSGDTGAQGCLGTNNLTGNAALCAENPASQPFVTGVGVGASPPLFNTHPGTGPNSDRLGSRPGRPT